MMIGIFYCDSSRLYWLVIQTKHKSRISQLRSVRVKSHHYVEAKWGERLFIILIISSCIRIFFTLLFISERLHWPEVEMSKKYILNSTDKALSPSHVCLEKMSSSVLKDLFSTHSSSPCIRLQAEEEKWESPKRSLYKKPKTSVKCAATYGKRKHPGMDFKKVHAQEGCGKPAQTSCVISGTNSFFSKPKWSFAVVGSTMSLTPRTVPKLRKCVSNSPRSKLRSLHKAAFAREVENGKKICIFTAIKPSNVKKEKVTFFKSDFNYNPQFEYSDPISPLVLARHNNSSDRFLTQVRSFHQMCFRTITFFSLVHLFAHS